MGLLALRGTPVVAIHRSLEATIKSMASAR